MPAPARRRSVLVLLALYFALASGHLVAGGHATHTRAERAAPGRAMPETVGPHRSPRLAKGTAAAAEAVSAPQHSGTPEPLSGVGAAPHGSPGVRQPSTARPTSRAPPPVPVLAT